jgi:hypothetical protein
MVHREDSGISPTLHARMRAITTAWLRQQISGQNHRNLPV